MTAKIETTEAPFANLYECSAPIHEERRHGANVVDMLAPATSIIGAQRLAGWRLDQKTWVA